MDPSEWVALATVFTLGAMSPGPSLAVVLRNTVSGGRSQGISTGIGHGVGFGIYAFLAALGIATAISANEDVEQFLQVGGVLILLWLGVTFLRHAMAGPRDATEHAESHGLSERVGFVQGFSIAILNPKIMAWMLALYAPFIEADSSLETLIGMGILGMFIDGTWYVTVATVLTVGNRADVLRSKAHLIDGAMGAVMFLFAYILVGGF
ncbi:MAG: LysE family translocator [Candidatus Thalassarchaeaceae archaeon]|nr:LysE family translocator [Candidatus Thalassarchaeaceae archaeon]